MSRQLVCGPYVCPYPDPAGIRTWDIWVCPNCGHRYRLSRRIPQRPWRDWYAPDGEWRLTWRQPYREQARYELRSKL